MQIKAIQFRKDGFYTQPFAFGGEEVILIDTGLPAGFPEGAPDEHAPLSTTAWHLKTCRKTGNVRVANVAKTSLIRHRDDVINQNADVHPGRKSY